MYKENLIKRSENVFNLKAPIIVPICYSPQILDQHEQKDNMKLAFFAGLLLDNR